MLTFGKSAFALLLLCVTVAYGVEKQPNIGYLYPAGGQQGTIIKIAAGGQFLGGARDVYISGEGVKASVVRYCGRAQFFK